MKTIYKAGDKIKVTNTDFIRYLRGKHEALRLLKNGESQTFINGSGKYAGQLVPEVHREDEEYEIDPIEGSVRDTTWLCHPIGGCDWERDKFQYLDIMLSFGVQASLKGYWVEKTN